MALPNISGDVDFSSDSEDEDYVPSGEGSEDDDPHSEQECVKDDDDEKPKSKNKRKLKNKEASRKRRGGIKLEDDQSEEVSDEEEESVVEETEKKTFSAEQEKSKVDALWADFLKDTKTVLKPKKQNDGSSNKSSDLVTSETETTNHKEEPKPEKVTVTKVYQFAGEEVKVQEVVSATEAKKTLPTTPSSAAVQANNKSPIPSHSEGSTPNIKSPSIPVRKTGGLSDLIGKISGKTPKLSTLEKSRLDWNSFKVDEGIEEELTLHNKGKEGYLERQAFLQRSDVREFELERSIRQNSRSKR